MDRRFRVDLVQFGALTAAISWIPWIALGATGTDVSSGAGEVVFAVAAAGPTLAALVLWLRRPRERVAPRMRWRASWVLLALVAGGLGPVVAALVLAPGDIASHATATVAGVGGVAGVVAYTLISGPLSEEFGWRGYLQPRVRRMLPHRWAASAVIGLAWWCWHLPLFFLPGTSQHDKGLLTVEGACFLASLLVLSFVALFLVERLRGGVASAVLLHASWNVADALMPPTGTAGALVQLAAMVAVAVVVAVWPAPQPKAADQSPLLV